MCAFVCSKLDCCNSFLAGCLKYPLLNLQKGQIKPASLILRAPRCAQLTPLLHSLHWLPVEQGIEYKLSSLCFKIISDQGPTYLLDPHLYPPFRLLRSSADTRVFRIPSIRTKSSGQRSLSYKTTTALTQLPASICHASS